MFRVDHIVPRRGGSQENTANLQLLEPHCGRVKREHHGTGNIGSASRIEDRGTNDDTNRISKMDSQVTILAAMAAAIAAVASLMTAAIALAYTIRSDRRKAGMDVRYDYSVMMSIASKEPWLAHLTLQNMKDRSLVIYKIYLEIGHGLFVQIEDRASDPIILDAYGVYRRDYDTIEYYDVGSLRATGLGDIGLISNRETGDKTRRRLVLATSEGRYHPKRYVDIYDPRVDSFLRYRPNIVMVPKRLIYDGYAFGSETRYLLAFTSPSGERRMQPIHSLRFVWDDFRDWGMTEDTLVNKETLETFLQEQIRNGHWDVTNLEVIDPSEAREAMYRWVPDNRAVITLDWFGYNIRPRWQRWQSVCSRKVRSCWVRIRFWARLR